jgi:hypothetical protein
MSYKSGLAAFVLSMSFAAAAAAAPVWTVNSLNAIGCASNVTSFSTTVSGASGVGPERFRTIVDAAGLRYMDEDAGIPATNGAYGWNLYTSSSGGPTTASWPIPPATPITVNFEFINGVGGPVIFQRQVTLSRCDGGTIIGDVVLIPSTIIPTLGEWTMAGLVMTLMLAGGMALRRRSQRVA